jgi:TctA family transporter
VFFTRPISLACLIISAVIFLCSIISALRKRSIRLVPKEP